MTLPTQDAQVDEELAIEAQSGDRQAFNLLVKRHGPRMLNVAWRTMGSRADAEDAVQDAMAAAWFKLEQYDSARPFGPWIGRIVLNKCRDHLRRRKIARFFDIGPENRIDDLPSDAPDEHARAQSREMIVALNREISAMPGKLREAFVLFAFDGRSHAEAADILGVTEKAIETRIYRARKRLREKLEKI